MFKHILAPVDLAHGDKLSHALDVIADLARHYDAAVTYVGVTSPQPGSVAATPEGFAQKLDGFAAQQGPAGARAHTLTVNDPGADLDQALAKAATDLDADLIVMGSHIPHTFDLGSHGGHLARLTDRSIFLVRDAG